MVGVDRAGETPVSARSVPAVRDLAPEAFLQDHVLKRTPVVIEDALRKWKALDWTPEYLTRVAGSQQLRYRTEEGVREGNFGELIDRIFNTDEPAPYLRNIDLRGQLPALAPDLEPALPYCDRNWRNHFLMPPSWPAEVRKDLYEVFISRRNASFPYLHIDYWGMSAFLAQLYGRKEVILFPAEDAPYLYPTATNPLISSIRNLDNPDENTFPEFRRARLHRVILEPGDLLFNPGWWHTTRTLDASITVIWAYWNRHEWRDLLQHVRTRMSRKHSLVLLPYLRLVGLCNQLSTNGRVHEAH